jgi:hypothetical protein
MSSEADQMRNIWAVLRPALELAPKFMKAGDDRGTALDKREDAVSARETAASVREAALDERDRQTSALLAKLKAAAATLGVEQ